MYLGKNLDKAIVNTTSGAQLVVLDGRECKNPGVQTFCAPGVYVLHTRLGKAPGEVSYYGEPITQTYHADTSIPNTPVQAFTVHQGYTWVWVETDPDTGGGYLRDPREPGKVAHIPCASKAPAWVHSGPSFA
jgi:hypothetical protein